MARRIVVYLLITGILLTGSLAQAQQPVKVAKIGGLATGGSGSGRELLMRELRTLGCVEGKNIVVETRTAEGKLDRLPAAAEELLRLKVDVLATSSTSAAIAAKNATKTTPIVFFTVPDPIAAGLIDSLPRPGGNVTGITDIAAILAGKRLELLKEALPKLSRVAVLWDPQVPGNLQQWKESQLPARELALQLHSMEVSSAEKSESLFKEAIKARVAALSVSQSPLASSNRKRIDDLAVKFRLPAIYSRADYVESDGLMSYGPDRTEPYKRVAVFIDKILKGTNPSEIPVEQPMRFDFVINQRTAKQIGAAIRVDVLARATRIIR